ncbi:MAG: beta-galactosidase [Armatimonadetes bacterium]|nr:beta-galactosidase [Armatimonadota bacterium]
MQRMIWTVLLIAAAGAALGAPERKAMLINSFETPEDIGKVTARSVRVAGVGDHATEGQQALKVEFEKAEWPSAYFDAGGRPWDWREYGFLALDIYNPMEEEITFAVRVDDDPSADGKVHCRTAGWRIGPKKGRSFAFALGNSDPMAMGMRGGPLPEAVQVLMGVQGGPIDPGHITAFQIFLPQPAAPKTLFIDHVRLLPPVNYDAICDAFGQYTRADWSGKLKSEAEFAVRRAEEEAAIRISSSLPDRDEYGGWAKGPKLKGTGFFRTAKRDGRWWLVTPGGSLFLSLGVDVVEINNQATFVETRERMFTWLPEDSHPLAKHYGHVDGIHSGPVSKGRSFNFYAANLERKYGPDYRRKWLEFAPQRLRAWGFNTIANWSDSRLYDMKAMPYTATLGVEGDHARVASGSDYWGKMHDPFDPKFASDAESSFRSLASRLKNDPWCIGYFVDNEISWGGWGDDGGRYGLAYGSLVSGPDQPAKRVFVARLRKKYREIERLNGAWSVRLASWEALLGQPFKPEGAMNEVMKGDFSGFVKEFARQYFRVVRSALKKHDPNHLYLGCRFAWRTPEAVEASGEFCDVVSFNIYAPRVEPKDWEFTKALNKPCIIGEFHFGALDRGMLHTGLVSTASQEARAAMYKDYIRTVVDHPSFVGCHWFQYVDESLTGRVWDGENYNIGFVTATDTPYPEMVAAAQEVHGEAYKRRAARE